jgi:gliding motility-associated-like protein
MSSDNQNPEFIINKPGRYMIRQELTGKTGCITRDSAFITVYEGITSGKKPIIKYVTVERDNTVTGSFSLPANTLKSFAYSSADGSSFDPMMILTNHTFHDLKANAGEHAAYYKIAAVDSCGNVTESVVSRTMYLQITDAHDDVRTLSWNPYQGWDNVKDYNLERGHFFEMLPLHNNGQLTTYTDMEVPAFEYDDSVCYRTTAHNFFNDSSYSNIVCYDYLPQVYVPNIFTPNHDGHNDSFYVITSGIKEFSIRIYNRWGEQVYSGNKREKWDGRFKNTHCTEGLYIYILTAKANNGNAVYKKGSLLIAY